MKGLNPLVVIGSIAGALIAVDRFYQHPTYGNGLQAAWAAASALLSA